MRSRVALFVTVVGLTVLYPGRTQASPIVYNQPSVFPGSYSAWTSERAASGAGFRTWDNFSLSQPTLIDGVNWQGIYVHSTIPGNNPPVPDTTSWEISFWSNVAGQPGTLLQSETISVANVQRTVVGTTSFNLPPVVPMTLYRFEANLTTPFLADPGTTYWLSVLSNSPTFGPIIYAWYQGTGGNGISIQAPHSSGTGSTVSGDRTFSLEGQVVPEPSTLAVLFVGIGALLGYGRLRRTRSWETA